MGSVLEPNFIQFLRVLGYPSQDVSDGSSKAAKDVLQSDLFQLPNRDAFQKVVYFLFQVLDPDKCSSIFRDCWPILDKKQESDFRRNAFGWYKDLQTDNPERLPQITASLFLSPGGRKFLTFVSSFSRFVVMKKVKQKTERPPIYDSLSKPSWPLAKSILPQLMIENNEGTQAAYSALVSKHSKGQELIDRISVVYRDLKLKSKNLSDDNSILFQEAKTTLESEHKLLGDESPSVIVQLLEKKCAEKKKDAEELRNKFNQIEKNAHQSLDLVESTVCSQNTDSLLDLRKYPVASDNQQSLSTIFEKLLDKTISVEMDLSKMSIGPLPSREVRDAIDFVTKQKESCVTQQRHLDMEVLPSLENSIAVLRSQLSGVDWRQVFGHQNFSAATSSSASGDSPQFVVPPSPGIQLDVSAKPDGAPKSFLLRAVRDKQQHKHHVSAPSESLLHTPMRTECQREVKKLSDQYSPPWKMTAQLDNKHLKKLHDSHNSHGNSSDHFTQPNSSHFHAQSRASAIKSVDSESSKLSVFSPIMSSSRMEPVTSSRTVLSAYLDSGKKLNHSSIGLSSEPIQTGGCHFQSQFILEEEVSSVPEVKIDSECLKEAATPVSHRVTKAEPFRLSPSVLGGDFDSPPPPTTVKTSRRRDSGLVQIMSRMERFNSAEDTPLAAENKRLRSRLNDLISTLTFSPTSPNLLSDKMNDDPFLQIPNFPDLE